VSGGPLRRGAIGAALVLLALVAALPGVARASDGYNLTGLAVEGGATWHTDNDFFVSWDPNPPGSSSVVHWFAEAVSGGAPGLIYGEDTERWNAVRVKVPPVPGVYLFEAKNWRYEGFGTEAFGPWAKVALYFDDVRPGPVAIAAPAWVAAGTVVPIHLSQPTETPISGIRGYAVSIDQAATGSPCAAVDRCAATEVDLPNGIGDDSTTLPAPPEGISYVHAAAVSGAGMRSTTTATVPLGVDGSPPQMRLAGAPDGWAAGPVRLTALATDRLSGMAADGPGGPVTAIGVDGAPPSVAAGAAASATVTGQGTHRVVYWGRDAVGNAGDGSLPFSPPATATIQIDETDPTVRFLAGDPGDPERIEALVADSLSGPDARRGEITLRRVGSSGSFEPLPTDVERGRLVARWDSDDFPRGAYEFRAVGLDAAGNSASNLADGGAPLVLHNPVKREAQVAFGFGTTALVFPRCARSDGSRRCHRAVVHSFARRPAARAIPCCHGAVVGGRLIDAAGTPLPGQTVDVVERFTAGARHPDRHTAVTTDADGDFRTSLAPGPSREVSAEFAGTRHLTRAGGRLLRLRIRAGVHLRVSTGRVQVGGAPVVFRGRIAHPEARIPASGLPVELEFRLPGMPWTEFRTVQSDGAGRFHYPYSFSDDDSAGARFLFRAFVPATGGWPFAPATSRPLAVTG
jgi:hypothetical protein